MELHSHFGISLFLVGSSGFEILTAVWKTTQGALIDTSISEKNQQFFQGINLFSTLKMQAACFSAALGKP